MEDYDFLFKISILGNSNVGKSSLMGQYCGHTFFTGSPPTVGVDFNIKMHTVGKRRIKLHIWDTAGQEKFRGMVRSYYRLASAIVIVYSVTDRKSFEDVSYWLGEVRRECLNCKYIMLVANKTDLLETQRVVSTTEGQQYATNEGISYAECHATTHEGVREFIDPLLPALVADAEVGFEKGWSTSGASTDLHLAAIKPTTPAVGRKSSCCT